MGRIFVVCIAVLLLAAPVAFAAHPLITDDAGTQGKGKFQLELNGQYDTDREEGVKAEAGEIKASLSYGITDAVDVVVGLPYTTVREKEGRDLAKTDGIGDTSVEVKWHFFEKDWLQLAVKPGVTFPTGNEDKGLGSGRVTYGAFLIATAARGPGALHLNIGYVRNENEGEAEREDIWHASLAGELEVVKNLKAVANVGIERNPDPYSRTDAAFILGGLIYAVTESLSVDVGVKGGLTDPEADCTVLAGLAWKF
jgi:hypothetical protein